MKDIPFSKIDFANGMMISWVEATPNTPIITLTGDNPLVLEHGTAYTEYGATATDLQDGDLTLSIVTDATAVDVNTLGNYNVTYTVTDADLNTTVKTRVVQVVDTTAPVIYINGDTQIVINVGDVYVDAGANALDNVDGILSVVTSGTVDTNTQGIYTITYTVTDSSGNTATATREVSVLEVAQNAPVITLQGLSSVTITQGSVYVDDGATAIDVEDGDLTASIITDTSGVDTSTLGNYIVTYTVTDSDGNISVSTRDVIVVSSSINYYPAYVDDFGASGNLIDWGGFYWLPNLAQLPPTDPKFNAKIMYHGHQTEIDGTAFRPADMSLYYTQYPARLDLPEGVVADTEKSYVASESWTIVSEAKIDTSWYMWIVENIGNGNANLIVTKDDGTTVLNDLNVPFTIPSEWVAPNTRHMSNQAPQFVLDAVLGADTVAPVITLVGGNVTITEGDAYVDAGATATDDVDGDITADIVTVNNVNATTAGVYTVTYNVSDSAGNPALEVTRTVTVEAAVSAMPEHKVSFYNATATLDAGGTIISQTRRNVSQPILDITGASHGVSILTTGGVGEGAGGVATDGFLLAEQLETYTYNNTGSTITVTISGLDSAKTYRLDISGSRSATDTREAIVDLGGVTKTYLCSSPAGGNTTDGATYTGISPNVSGEISFTVSTNSGSFSYLGGMNIIGE